MLTFLTTPSATLWFGIVWYHIGNTVISGVIFKIVFLAIIQSATLTKVHSSYALTHMHSLGCIRARGLALPAAVIAHTHSPPDQSLIVYCTFPWLIIIEIVRSYYALQFICNYSHFSSFRRLVWILIRCHSIARCISPRVCAAFTAPLPRLWFDAVSSIDK